MPLAEYRTPVRKQLMRATAYEVLREAIISGELAPGEAIKDSELAAQLGLSRTPVREALVRLAEAGMVESKPGVYTRVSSLNRDEVAATLDVLQALHGVAVRDGVPRLDAGHLKAMREHNDRFAAAVERSDVAEALAADDAFHSVLVEASGNRVLARLIDLLHPTIDRILFRKFSTLLGGRDTIDHHKFLIRLCRKGDAEAAATLSAEHWSRLGGLIDKLFDSDDLPGASAS
jgi:DNA-binding GntR family transcriptional regulator